ncbi:nitrilase-related carbon-nitrogen hydrolase [Chitinophaga polysaccharea]|uniref:nitrilase-related carbon-nitrogen hydrolase n=1 Tax=Chitinophaga polysaccharea TaxID=1293035 RepID=UPI001FFD3226|nr:nitrilase-related carbon-nitrogen hydrolase [Chitinophaga polysaccharea]
MSDLKPVSKELLAAGLLFAGICWYLSFSLSSHIWWPLWVAPVPILYFSLRLTGKWTFLIAFAGYLIGRLSWVPYLLSVLPSPLVFLFTLLFPLIFALQVIAARKLMLTYSHWSTVFVFPVWVTTMEYLGFLTAPDGTAGSIAYTQCDFLPVVQIASLTGIQGITFLVTFFPVAIALIIYRYQRKQSIRTLSFVTIGVLVAAMVWGFVRLNQTSSATKSLQVGMAAIDKRAYHNENTKGEDRDLYLANLYLRQVGELAKQGAEIIVFPEKMFTVRDNRRPGFIQQFKDTAMVHHVCIVACVTQQKGDYYENRAWVIGKDGALLADYQKVHLFAGELLDSLKPGKEPGLFLRNGTTEGVAICKDMDFQQYISRYGSADCNVLYVPAWDFERDGWLHSRMAMMRCVEGGFGMVRNARKGRLTINDYCGRVLYEVNSDKGTPALLSGNMDIQHHATLYNKWGDWFSILNAIAFLASLVLLVKAR